MAATVTPTQTAVLNSMAARELRRSATPSFSELRAWGGTAECSLGTLRALVRKGLASCDAEGGHQLTSAGRAMTRAAAQDYLELLERTGMYTSAQLARAAAAI